MYLTNLSKLNNGLDAFDSIFDNFFNFPNTRPSTWTTINSFGTDYRVNENSLELSLTTSPKTINPPIAPIVTATGYATAKNIKIEK